MDRNIGPEDRVVRIVVALGLSAVIYFANLSRTADIVVAIVAGALLLAALPGGGPSGVGFASPTQRPTARATAQPTARPTATVKPQATPVAKPVSTPATATGPKPAGPGALDVCDPFFSVACGLDAGTYEPTHFVPAIRLKIGRGWSVADSRSEVLALTRDEGRLTFMSGITNVYPSGDPARAPGTARLLVEAFIETDGVAAGKPSDRKIDKHRATTVDLSPTGPDRVALFGSESQTFFLEPNGTTRLSVIDTDAGPVVIAIEPAADRQPAAIVKIATPVVTSVHFR